MTTLIEVVNPGPLTTVQDAGRSGFGHLGVPRAGAFDVRAWTLANRLVGNPQTAAALESLAGGLEFVARQRLTIAVTGAAGQVAVDNRGHATNAPIHVQSGARVVLGHPAHGIRYYVAIAGGVDVAPVLGSRSFDTLGQIGPAPLQAGQVVPVGEKQSDPTIDHAPVTAHEETFEILPGPDASPGLLDRLVATRWELDPQSNRIGVRLQGTALPVARTSLPSKPMVLGAVQLPPNGLPIILGPDHPTTGGYPVIAVVTRRSMDDVAQWSGGPRRFAHRR